MRIALAILLFSHAARADDDEPPPIPPPPPLIPVADDAPDVRWSYYDAAFEKLGAGDRAGAHALLERALVGDAHHPVAALATARLADLDAHAPDSDGNRVARGELVFWSTASGVLLASEVCVALDCQGDRAYAGVYTITVGASLATSLLASTHVQAGEAQLYNSAQTWAAWNALALNDGFANTPGEAGIAIAAQGVGVGAGYALWHAWHPTPGAVALTNSAFLWTTILALEGYAATGNSPTLGGVVLASDAGILVGALASSQVEMSRGRTLVIDLGGVIGSLAGGLIAATTHDDQSTGVSLLVGTGVGLIAATLASASWDAPKVAVVPTRIGTTWGAAISLTR